MLTPNAGVRQGTSCFGVSVPNILRGGRVQRQDFTKDSSLGGWVIAGSGAVVDGALQITPELGTERLSNTGFSDTTYWSNGLYGWSISEGVANYTSQGSVGSFYRVTGSPYTLHQFMKAQFEVVSSSSCQFTAMTFTGTPDTWFASPGTYTVVGMKTTDASMYFFGAATGSGAIDNVSLKQITLPTMLAMWSQPLGPNIDVQVGYTQTRAGELGGVVICADSPTDPTTGIFVFTNGVRHCVWYLTGGVFTRVQDVAMTYSAGCNVGVQKSGSVVRAMYNGARAGNVLSLTEESVINNSYWGVIGTSSIVSLTYPQARRL